MKANTKTSHLQKSLYWNLTSLCNLRCDFCGVGDLNRNKTYINREVRHTSSHLKHFYRAIGQLNGRWEIFIGGGEPFVFPGFQAIVKSMVGLGHVVSVATNFTLPLEKYMDFCDAAGQNINLFLASYKPWAHDLDKFMEKARALNDRLKEGSGKFSVGAVATAGETRHLYDTGLHFLKHGIEFSLQVERINGDYRVYESEEENMIRYFGRTYGLGEKKNFKGKKCHAGPRYFVLSPMGDAYRCHSANAYPEIKNGYLGNVISGSFLQPKTPSTCPYPVCNCVNAYNMKLIEA